MNPVEPWRPFHLLVLAFGVGGGGVAIAVSWWGASSTVNDGTLIAYTVFGVTGVISVGAANCFWLAVGRRAVSVHRHARTDDVRALVNAIEDAWGRAVRVSGGADALVALAGMALYHRRDCQLVRGKPAAAALLSSHRRAGRRACGVCAP